MTARRGIGLDAVRRLLGGYGPFQPATRPGPVFPDAASGPARRPSAVLVVLFEEDGEARVVLTGRASTLRSHTGEVSFPGGRVDDGEEAVAAALREAAEEIDLDPSTVEIVGQLAPLRTISNPAAITPFVGLLADRPELTPNPAEVERIFDVALSDLLAEGVFSEERWDMGEMTDRPIYFFDLGDDLVWGATARMLFELLIGLTGAVGDMPAGGA